MKNEEVKLGCLIPLYFMVFVIILCLTIIFMLNCKGYNAEEEIDNIQLNEMIQYHRSEGREIIVFE